MESVPVDKKKLRIDGAGTDRISNLPDTILCKIISLLSIKNAVATKLLSTRWNNLFPFHLSPLYLPFKHLWNNPLSLFYKFFDEPAGKSVDSSADFKQFADKLLRRILAGLPGVEIMRLSCRERYDVDKIVSWVNAALQLKVPSLGLRFSMDGSGPLFDSLNGCATLVSLSLKLNLEKKSKSDIFTFPILRKNKSSRRKNAEFGVPDKFILPNLNKLTLSELVFDDEDDNGDSVIKILEGCPALEDLSLIDCTFFLSEEAIVIKSTLLKCFSVDSSQYTGCRFEIDAPNLERLMFRCSSTRGHRISKFRSLHTAHIDTRTSTLSYEKAVNMRIQYDEETDNFVNEGILQLASACSSTTSLQLTHRSIYALYELYVRLPEFQNLTSLRLGSLKSHGWALLAQLLLNSPNLEKLVFEEEFTERKTSDREGGYADFEYLVSLPPMCLKLHVKEIEFRVFNWKDEESRLLSYFLENGKVLEKVLLRCLPSVIKILTRTSSDQRIIIEAR